MSSAPMSRQPVTRRSLLQATGAAAALAATATLPNPARAAGPPPIRYATGGGIGPNELETVIFLDWMKQNVLKRYGKDYTLTLTFTRSTADAASLLAAGQVDLGSLATPVFAAATLKNAIPGGATILADVFDDGVPGHAANAFFVLNDAPIHSVADLKGKKVAVNAYGTIVDLPLRIALKKAGLDPVSDVEIVEIGFPDIGPALRQKRIDCGSLVLPFMPIEVAKGGIRQLFSCAEALGGPYTTIFQTGRNDFLKSNGPAVRSMLADYTEALHWLYDPANRAKAIELTATLTKSSPKVLETYFLLANDFYRDLGGCIRPAYLQRVADAMLSQKLLPGPIDMGKYLDLSYLPGKCAT